MTDQQKYEAIKAKGQAAEMEVHGVLRGGYVHKGIFAFHRGTAVQFAPAKNVRIF